MFICKFCKRKFDTCSGLYKHDKLCVYRKCPTIKKRIDNDAVKRLIEDVEVLKNQPQTVTNITNVTNIIITKKLDEDFFQAVSDKLGHNKALDLFNTSIADNDVVEIYKQLYPSNKLAENPVVFHDNTFKYLDQDNNLISDNSILTVIARRLQLALLHASNELISTSILAGRTNQLYELYDIGKIQSNIKNFDEIKNQIGNYIMTGLEE